MKPRALVFEFIPKFTRSPPPKASPCSKIARPSPELTNSLSLQEIKKVKFRKRKKVELTGTHLFVLIAFATRPSVAGPAPTMSTSALVNLPPS